MIEGRLLEREVKAIILNHLIKRDLIKNNTTIINEFTIGNFSRRVDLALVNPNRLIAFEVKSEADSLSRLEGQVEKYLEYFDKVVVVGAPKHIAKILKVIPKSVAVWEVSKAGILIKQHGKIKPINNKEKFIDLMKANELLKVANRLGIPLDLKNRGSLVRALNVVSVNKLKRAALFNIAKRFKFANSLFWGKVKSSNIMPHHIDFLSPYKEERDLLSLQEKQRTEMLDRLRLGLCGSPDLAEVV